MRYSDLLAMMNQTDKHLLILGRGGSGKTHIVNQFLETTDLRVLRTAPTGLAAMGIIGASTNHSAFGLVPSVSFRGSIPRLQPNHAKAIKKADVWLVDEMSMVRSDQLVAIDAVLRAYRQDPRPLGGIRLIAVGDLWQLSPVSSEIEAGCLEQMGLSDPLLSHGIYGTDVLDQVLTNATIVELEGVFRQSPEERDFVSLLDRCRRGSLTPQDMELLSSRVSFEIIPGRTVLTSTRMARDYFNDACLKQIPWGGWTVEPDIRWEDGEIPDPRLLTDCPASRPLHLKLGMRIMFNKNDPTGHWVNGTQGTLTNIDPIGTNRPTRLAVQVDGQPWPITVHRHDFGIYLPHFDAENKRGQIKLVANIAQFPIEPAYATTIHRSQGRTLPAAVLHLGTGAFASGQTYVGLSRVPSLSALQLAAPILNRDVISSVSARKFYQQFENQIQPVFPD